MDGSIIRRVDLATKVVQAMSKVGKFAFTGTKPIQMCKETWEKLFTSNWVGKKMFQFFNETKELGSGAHGKVFKVKLKALPNSPLAVKRTNEIEVQEIRYAQYASLLVVACVNPHFVVTYAHMRCEYPNGQMGIKLRNGQYIPWVTGQKEVERLMRTSPLTPDIIQQITQIRNKMYASLEDIKKMNDLKTTMEHAFMRMYNSAKINPTTNNDDGVLKTDMRLLAAVQQECEYMQNSRKEFHNPFDFILMEKVNHNFQADILDRGTTSDADILSISFQVCVASLSMLSFFNISQNDLLLHNIMYDTVPVRTRYVYKINNTFFDVDLCGRIMKMIDFGLTRDEHAFHAWEVNGTNDHWCVGGLLTDKAKNIKDFQNLKCSFFMRDILEYFYNLREEAKSHRSWSYGLKRWITDCHLTAQQMSGGTLENTKQFVISAFSPEIFKQFGLTQSIVVSSSVEIPVNTHLQPYAFEVCNTDKYGGVIEELLNTRID